MLDNIGEDKVFNSDEKAKLTQLVNEGIQVMTEMDILKEGLNDTIKAVAEEMQIKPSVLKKAVSVAHKATYQEEQAKHELLENILETVGRTI